MPNTAPASGSNCYKCPPQRGNPQKERRWEVVAPYHSGEWCVSMHTPVQQGMVDICRDGGRSQGAECLLNQCPLHIDLHKLLNQGKREVFAWGPAPARATSHTQGCTSLAQISSSFPSRMLAPIICLHFRDISFLWPQSQEEAVPEMDERDLFLVATQQP